MFFITSSASLFSMFLKSSFLVLGFVAFCVFTSLFEVLFLPIQQKLLTRANDNVTVLNIKLIRKESKGRRVVYTRVIYGRC